MMSPMKKFLAIVILCSFWSGNISANEAQLFGIKLNQDLFKSIDADSWLKEKCINKKSYSAFIRYQEVPKYNDAFPVVKAEVNKCKVFGVWGDGFFKRKNTCRKKIEPFMKTTIQRLKKEYEVSKIISGNPLFDDKYSKSAVAKKGSEELTLYGFCHKDPQGYFMHYGLINSKFIKLHSKYEGTSDPSRGL